MAALQLSRDTTHLDLLTGLHNARVLDNDDWTKLAAHVPENGFLSTAAIASRGAWGGLQVEHGRQFDFFGSRNDLNYLSRLDLFRHLNFGSYNERFERHPEAGHFTPILPIGDEDRVMAASNAICDLVLSQFDSAREFLPAMDWSVYEIVENIRLHSNTSAPGIVVAQYYPKRDRLDIAICDSGRSIIATRIWKWADESSNTGSNHGGDAYQSDKSEDRDAPL